LSNPYCFLTFGAARLCGTLDPIGGYRSNKSTSDYNLILFRHDQFFLKS